MNKRLYRSRKNHVIGGVCGGLGEYLDIDPTIVRILFVIGFFTMGFGVLAYLVAMLIMPERPREMTDDYVYDEHDKHQPTHHFSSGNTRLIIGIILIIFGGVSIAEKIFHWFDFDLLWPVALIGVGFIILTRDRK